jgi:RNA polymerase sigma-70 factor (ECF subfamily)
VKTGNAPNSSDSTRKLSDPERWVDEHGDYLFKIALWRLRDPAKAEDMVQETFFGGIERR